MAHLPTGDHHWLPTTGFGRWAVRLAVMFVGLLLFAQLLVMSGERGGERFSDDLLLAIPMLAAGVVAVSAGALGAAAMARGERSRVVYAVAAVGLIVIVFVIGELFVPH